MQGLNYLPSWVLVYDAKDVAGTLAPGRPRGYRARRREELHPERTSKEDKATPVFWPADPVGTWLAECWTLVRALLLVGPINSAPFWLVSDSSVPGVHELTFAGWLNIAEVVEAAEGIEDLLPIDVTYYRRIRGHVQGFVNTSWVSEAKRIAFAIGLQALFLDFFQRSRLHLDAREVCYDPG